MVEDTKIWTGCEFVYNLYDNGQDTAFYMSRDQINALAIGNLLQLSTFCIRYPPTTVIESALPYRSFS